MTGSRARIKNDLASSVFNWHTSCAVDDDVEISFCFDMQVLSLVGTLSIGDETKSDVCEVVLIFCNFAETSSSD